MNIKYVFIIVILLFIVVQSCNCNYEKFTTNLDDIQIGSISENNLKTLIYSIYQEDVAIIDSLTNFATIAQNGSLLLTGNLTMTGELKLFTNSNNKLLSFNTLNNNNVITNKWEIAAQLDDDIPNNTLAGDLVFTNYDTKGANTIDTSTNCGTGGNCNEIMRLSSNQVKIATSLTLGPVTTAQTTNLSALKGITINNNSISTTDTLQITVPTSTTFQLGKMKIHNSGTTITTQDTTITSLSAQQLSILDSSSTVKDGIDIIYNKIDAKTNSINLSAPKVTVKCGTNQLQITSTQITCPAISCETLQIKMVDSNYNYKLSTNAKTLLNTNISSIQLTTDQLSKMTCPSRIILSDIQKRALNTQQIALNTQQIALTTQITYTDISIDNSAPFNSIQLSSNQKTSLSTQIGTLDLHAYQIFPWNNIIMTPNQKELLNTANNTLRIDYPTFNTITNSDITCKMMIITGRANETKLITDTYLSADDLKCTKMQKIIDLYNTVLTNYKRFNTYIHYVELPSI